MYLLVAGFGCIALAIIPGMPPTIAISFTWVGAAWLLTSFSMILGSKFFKLRIRDRVLDSLQLKGDERVLDIGCGRGLMLIGLAKRLPNGKAVGIDLWKKADQSGNTEEAVRRNAQVENVTDRIEIETGDMRRMPFHHESFDHVVSSWAIHNLPDTESRSSAIIESIRVLKPGGKLIVVDIFSIDEYVELLRTIHMEDVTVSKPNFTFIVPSRTIRATKPIRRIVDKNLTLS